MFHPKSQYAKVCADVVLVNPPGTLPDHKHEIPPTKHVHANGKSSDLKDISIGNN